MASSKIGSYIQRLRELGRTLGLGDLEFVGQAVRNPQFLMGHYAKAPLCGPQPLVEGDRGSWKKQETPTSGLGCPRREIVRSSFRHRTTFKLAR